VATQFTVSYPASIPVTITLGALASSTAKLAGRESSAIDNSAAGAGYIDLDVAGRIMTGTAPTAGKIEVWAIGPLNDTPTWPDAFDGVDSAETITTDAIKASICRLVASISTDTTANRSYPFGPVSLAAVFGGSFLPLQVILFVTHDTVAALNATGANHAIWIQPKFLIGTGAA
jgi:hypothetical protein